MFSADQNCWFVRKVSLCHLKVAPTPTPNVRPALVSMIAYRSSYCMCVYGRKSIETKPRK